jgi:hypothetical protein
MTVCPSTRRQTCSEQKYRHSECDKRDNEVHIFPFNPGPLQMWANATRFPYILAGTPSKKLPSRGLRAHAALPFYLFEMACFRETSASRRRSMASRLLRGVSPKMLRETPKW